MAKKKHTHQDKSTKQEQQQQDNPQNPKMDPNDQPDNPNPTTIEDPSDKVSSLKSLNAMLLKETVEKRQEVSALLESKKSLESELTRSESQVESLRAELARMEEMAQLGEVVRDKEMEIGSLRKLEGELRDEIEKGTVALSQAMCEIDELKRELGNRVEEGSRMRERISVVESNEKRVSDELEEVKGKYKDVSMELEQRVVKVESMRVELGSLEKECVKLNKEIEGLSEEKDSILQAKAALEGERREQDARIEELVNEARGLNEIVSSLREDEEKWRVKCFELEKANGEMGEKVQELGREMSALLEDKKEKERVIEGLMEEKSKAEERLIGLEKELESLKQVKDEVLDEKNRLEMVKSKQENEILELQNEVGEHLGNVRTLQESNSDHIEKNRQLLSEIDDHKRALDLTSMERDDAKKALEEEKANGMKLQVKVSEISKRMEETAKVIEELRATGDTLVGEKKEIESKYSKLVEEKGLAEKKLADALMKIAELEVAMKSKTDMLDSAMAMMKKTALQLSAANEKHAEGGSKTNDRDLNDDMEPLLAELKAIRAAFRNREEKVWEMQEQMESLRWSVMEARKKKSFWTLVSSATTIIAAVVSFAYAARVR